MGKRKEVPRKDVGVRNPYAMAEQLLGVKIDWVRTPLENRKQILEKTLKTSYKKLFGPGHGSPVYKSSQKTKGGEDRGTV